MSQESLDFGRLYKVSDGVRGIYRSLADAVDQVGILPAAGACGADRTDLRKALDRDGRFLRVEWAMSIGAMALFDVRKQIASSFVGPLGFRVADELPPLSDKERADRLEGALASLGPIGQQALIQALVGRR
jgi:hypothetical protein